MIIQEYQNTNTFLKKDYTLNSSDKVFMVKKLIIVCHGHLLLVILTVKKLLERFTKKISKKQIKEILDMKKFLREKLIKKMLNAKNKTNLLA